MRTVLYLLAVGIAASCLGTGCSGTAHEASPTRAKASPGAQSTVFQTEAASKSQSNFNKSRRPSQGPPLGPVSP
jgi:hypothetical protein